jgi:hypothetical protein
MLLYSSNLGGGTKIPCLITLTWEHITHTVMNGMKKLFEFKGPQLRSFRLDWMWVWIQRSGRGGRLSIHDLVVKNTTSFSVSHFSRYSPMMECDKLY